MQIYEFDDIEQIADALMLTLEHQTGKNIFTMRLLDENRRNETLDAVIIFTDKSVLMGRIIVEKIAGRLACRIVGDYI